MSKARLLGHSEIGPHDLYLLSIDSLGLTQEMLDNIDDHFVVCLAMDGTKFIDQEIKNFASILIQAGCSYFCCWGQDCERIHDLFDLTAFELDPEGPCIITTWHADTPLSEAIWAAMNTAWPDPVFEDSTKALIGISVGNPSWSEQFAIAFSNPHEFNQAVMNQ